MRRNALLLIFALWCSISANVAYSASTPKEYTLDVLVEFEDSTLKQYEPRLRYLIKKAFEEFSGLFGGMPKQTDGSDYTTLSLSVKHGAGGEADPGVIELGINDVSLFDFYDWEMVLLHEVFHLWSAETFRYVSEREQWFNEGAADYYAFQLAAKLGLISPDQVVTNFSAPIANYLSAKGVTELSMSAAAELDGGKQKHYFLIYHGGFTASMVLDHQIRLNSNGRYSLDYVMHELYWTHSRENRYSNESLITLIDDATGYKAQTFFDKYITGSEPLVVGEYFDLGMLEFNRKLNVPLNNPAQKALSKMLTFESLD